MSGRQFSFPILSTEQVLSCMEEYGIPLTEPDIKKPQPEKMVAIYDRFVEDIMGVFREDLQQPQFGALDAFEQPELHEESVPQMLFYKALYVHE